jgi:hypothetical protein
MPEEPLDHIERHTMVHQEAGERVVAVMCRCTGGRAMKCHILKMRKEGTAERTAEDKDKNKGELK